MASDITGISSMYRPPAFRDTQPANIPIALGHNKNLIPAVAPPTAHDLTYDRFSRLVPKVSIGDVINLVV